MSIYTPYFYIIQEVRTGLYYAGSKYGKKSNPNLLLQEGGYLTSCKRVTQLINDNGIDSFVIRKIKHFKTAHEAYEYESRFLSKVNASKNPKFINAHNNQIPTAAGTESYKEMMLSLYGVDHNMKIPEVQQARLQKINDRYGSMSEMMKQSGALETYKDTCMKRYGIDSALKLPSVQKKREQTCLEKYGVSNIFKSSEIQKNMRQKGLKTFARNYDEAQKPKIEKLLASNIDFSKFGWVKEAAKIIDITDQKVGKWMKRNMPEFYESSCYKRNSTKRNKK
jgi:hypothetical protein